MEWISYVASAVVVLALVAIFVVIQVRRTRRRRLRKRPWITRSEAFGSVAVVILLVAIVTHTR